MNLSKSRYCKGIRCPKILWLDEHKSEVRDDSVVNQEILDTGNEVGDLAMVYYGDYTEVPYSEDKSLMLAETRRLLAAKTLVICEASFSHDGNFCSVDILRNGDEAMAIYKDLPGKDPEEKKRIRSALLAYCRLDTLAMVKALEKLQELN